jgi:hypothetical protein
VSLIDVGEHRLRGLARPERSSVISILLFVGFSN